MDGLLEPWQTLKYGLCCPSENPLPVAEGVWIMCSTKKTGRYGAWLSTVAGQMLTGSDLGTKHIHYR